MRPNSLVLFAARFNQAVRTKQKVFTIPFTKKVYQFLICLERNKLILTYQCSLSWELLKLSSSTTSPFILKIYPLYYSNYSLFSHLSFRSTKKQIFNFSVIAITKFRKSQKTSFSPILLLETASNILTQNEAIQQGVGGRLLCVFYRFTK
jgi:ribosomal protein S8